MLAMKAVALAGLAGALQMGSMDAPVKPKQYVVYSAERQVVAAGKKTVVEVQFHVQEGYHVNSHTPRSELLIPTNLTLKPGADVKAGAAEYPKGQEYSFAFEPGEKLDVYSGAFTVKVPVEAAAGEHTIDGTLRYQACDKAACYPPKTLPVQVLLTAK